VKRSPSFLFLQQQADGRPDNPIFIKNFHNPKSVCTFSIVGENNFLSKISDTCVTISYTIPWVTIQTVFISKLTSGWQYRPKLAVLIVFRNFRLWAVLNYEISKTLQSRPSSFWNWNTFTYFHFADSKAREFNKRFNLQVKSLHRVSKMV
jgi:hypothetical protein